LMWIKLSGLKKSTTHNALMSISGCHVARIICGFGFEDAPTLYLHVLKLPGPDSPTQHSHHSKRQQYRHGNE
jgi:hypothetical protein